ncbi:MAG: HAMP domain-containing histidine kinase [Candidatus Omnitrophica bacterium]|nr:HAMP domain-containing histidine kinase [Candidatus Omnitrophota bacterium]
MVAAPESDSDQSRPLCDRQRIDDSLKEVFEDFHHDTRSLLTRVLTTVALLERKIQGDLSVSQEQSLQSIRSNCSQLQMMADNLLEWLGIHSPRGQDMEIDLNREILDAVDRFSGAALMKGIQLEASHPPFPVLARGPQGSVGRILDNLLTNALNHTPEAGHVRIVLEKNENQMSLMVADTGCGIPSEMLEHLFERGGSGSSPGQSMGPGKGLGLFITRQLARSMGAGIEVESNPGKGSTFRITFPEYPGAPEFPEKSMR